jgi:ubiquinone/menaquinone biosynthesis C-methylase UbiE
MNQMILREIESIFQIERSQVEREFSPYFYRYFAECFSSLLRLDRYRELCKHIFDVTQAKGKRVLDVGCGFGLTSLFLNAFGCGRVVCVDHNEEKIAVFQKILSRFDPPLLNIEARLDDAISLQCWDESYDVAVVNDVVSHVRDLDALLSEMRRVLIKGGILYILDGNNALDIFKLYHRRKFWRKIEYGPVDEADFRGTDKPIPWLFLRREMIKEKFSHLDSKIIDLLARETAGLYADQIVVAVKEYLRERRIVNKPKFKFRNPETGEYPEFVFNPFGLRKKLEKAGFSARLIKPYFSLGYPSSLRRGILYNTVAWVAIRGIRALHPLSLLIAPRFEILARKKH